MSRSKKRKVVEDNTEVVILLGPETRIGRDTGERRTPYNHETVLVVSMGASGYVYLYSLI